MSEKQNNDEFLEKTIKVSVMLFLGIAFMSIFFFKKGDSFDWSAWINLIVSFIGALLGGIFTMLGVKITLDKQNNFELQVKKDKKLKNKIEIQKISSILYYESHEFLLSVTISIEILSSFLIHKQGEIKDLSFYKKFFRGLYEVSDNFYDSIKDLINCNFDFLGEDFVKFKKCVIKNLLEINNINNKLKKLNTSDKEECESMYYQLCNLLNETLRNITLNLPCENNEEFNRELGELEINTLNDIMNIDPKYEKMLYYLGKLEVGEFEIAKESLQCEEL
ncbi:hypothetical protein N2W38_000965 [Clostridium perfringens]|nr:hypothetical protein [Clostridium perfringens]EJT6620698.1 hypothetical protein [Clostridium perfringens]